tara:strand:+ start:1085 stop:1996 length:912 start_codon:yes stop_codon:yes gene_type:complete
MFAIKIENIKKKFGTLKALSGVTLQIKKGEFFGLLGPNGAGKTTLISSIAGLTIPDEGLITIHDQDVIKNYTDARKLIGVVPQELVFDPFFTVIETLKMQSGYFGIKNNDSWINEIMINLDLLDKANKNMRTLSGGMKRRVLVAQALVHKPPVIMLDEPTAGVDVGLRQTLWGFIKKLNKQGHTVILTTHYLEEAEALCNRVAMMKSGKIVALDSTDALINRISGLQLVVKLSNGKLPDSLLPLLSNANNVGADENYILRVSNNEDVEDILSSIRLSNAKIENMQLKKADLEDVFIQIMEGDK